MGEDEIKDESKEANEFIDAILKKSLQDSIDQKVGFERCFEPMLVMECLTTIRRENMIFYYAGYCLCSRFYKCRYQSNNAEIVEGKERLQCTKKFGGFV